MRRLLRRWMRTRQPPRCSDRPARKLLVAPRARSYRFAAMDNPAIARLDAAITRVENAIAARRAAAEGTRQSATIDRLQAGLPAA